MRSFPFSLLLVGLLSGALSAQLELPPQEEEEEGQEPFDIPQFPQPGESDDPPAGEEPIDEDPRGYFGAITDDRQKQPGVQILEVVEGGPAAAAGLEARDLIVAINGQPVREMADFAKVMKASRAGDEIKLQYQRGGTPAKPGATADTVVTLGRRPAPPERAFPEFGRIGNEPASEPGDEPPQSRGLLGIRMAQFDASFVRRLQVPAQSGVIVAEVYERSPAQRAGIPRNALIVSLNGRPTPNPGDLARAVTAVGAGREVEVGFYTGRQLNKRRVMLGNPPPEKALPIAAPNPRAVGAAAGERNLAKEVEHLQRQVQNLHERLSALEKKLQEKEPAKGSAE